MEGIKTEDLNFSYERGKTVFENVDLTFEPGTISVISGPSGCGKSTLCKILCGIIPHSIDGDIKGRVIIGGEDISSLPLSKIAKWAGYVMQDPGEQMVASTVEDELAFGPENLALEPDKIRRRVDEVMKFLGIEELALADPAKLSGGQRQLVAVGAVLAMDSDIIVMDEPMSSLDKKGRLKMQEILIGLRDKGKTVIIAEHDITALDMADKWVMFRKNGIKEKDKYEPEGE